MDHQWKRLTQGRVYRQADDYDRDMPYDPSAFPPFAVTVDLVGRTARRHALCALAVRRGTAFPGRWALPGGFVRPDEDLAQAAARELVEETGLRAHDPSAPAGQRRAPGTAGDLRRPQARPADEGGQRRPSRAGPRSARAQGREATPTARAGRRWRSCCNRAVTAATESRPHPSPSTTPRSSDGVERAWFKIQTVAGHRLLPVRVHRRRAAPSTRLCGGWHSTRATSTAR